MKRVLIINALIWAAVILLASFLVGGADKYEALFGVLLVAAGLQNSILYVELKRQRKA